MHTRLQSLCGLLVLAGVVHFGAAAAAVQLLRGDYAPAQAPLSLYLSGDYGRWLQLAYYGLAAAVATLGVALQRSLDPAARYALVPVLLGCGAVALAVTATWPGPAPGHPVTPLGELLHGCAAIASFLWVGTAMLLQSCVLHRDRQWRAVAVPALVLAVLAFAGLWLHALWRDLPRGTSQKAVIALYLAWLGLAGRQLLRGARHGRD